MIAAFLRLEIPLAGIGTTVRTPAEADRAIGYDHLASCVKGDRFPVRVVVLAELVGEVAGAYVAARRHHLGAVRQCRVVEPQQQRQIGVAPCVIVEVRGALVEVKLLQRDVTHCHRQGGIGALLGMHPEVGELRDFGVVRRDRNGLRALVSDLGEEVRVGRARLRDVAAPGNDVGRVVPVGTLRHIGLLTPDLRARRGQVAVPVVEAHADAADQRQVAAARGVTHHAHRGNRREADDAVRAVRLDRVDVGGSDQLVDFVPARAHEAAHAAHLLVVTTRGRVLDDGGPRIDGAFS